MISTNEQTLRLKSELFEGTEEELKELIRCLEFEMNNSKRPGIGLSAIQIMIPKRVAIIRILYKDKRLKIERMQEINLYNAEIIEAKQPFVFKQEGCLSMPNTYCDTDRYNWIKIKNGDGKEEQYSGLVAVAIQHELDHWDGKLVTDREKEKE
jgi:peptide deformylase